MTHLKATCRFKVPSNPQRSQLCTCNLAEADQWHKIGHEIRHQRASSQSMGLGDVRSSCAPVKQNEIVLCQWIARTIQFNRHCSKNLLWWKKRQCSWVGKSRKATRKRKLCHTAQKLKPAAPTKSSDVHQTPHRPGCHAEVRVSWKGGGDSPATEHEDVPTYLERHEAQQVVVARLLSRAGSWEAVKELLQQPWLSEWHEWQELQQNMTDEMCMRIAKRLYDIALRNIPASKRTNAMALQELEQAGFRVERAQSFQMNNCLIDAIILSLCASGLMPSNVRPDLPARCQLTVCCRDTLARKIGAAVRPTVAGIFPYLDASRDAPAVVKFLCREFNISPLPPIVLYVHDRFGETLDVSVRTCIQMPWCPPNACMRATHIHLFNYTAENGEGYYFDSGSP